LSRPPSVILAVANKSKTKDVNFIRDWAPVSPDQAIEFDTVVGEKVLLSFVSEGGLAGKKRHANDENEQADLISLGDTGPPQQPSNKRGGISGNYRGGNQNRGRGRDRRDERGRGRGGGRGGRGGGGPARGGRGPAHAQSGDSYHQGHRGGYMDYDAAGGRSEQGGSGLYNAY